MLHRAALLCGTTVLGCGAPQAPATPPSPPTSPEISIVSGARIVTPGRAPIEHGFIVIEGERIREVGRGTPPAIAGAHRLDVEGRTVTPGLIDAHVHLGSTPGLDPAPAEVKAAYFEQLPRSYLYYGFTTVVDLAPGPDAAIERVQASPLHPDVVHCGGGVSAWNGYPMVFAPEPERARLFPHFVVEPGTEGLPESVDPAAHQPAAVVEALASSGASCVKAFSEDGFGAPIWPSLSEETLRSIGREAKARDLTFVVHANSLAAHQTAVTAGADVIAHGAWNWDDDHDHPGLPPAAEALVDQLTSSGTAVMPTFRVIDGLGDLVAGGFENDPALAAVLPSSVLAWYATPAAGYFRETLVAAGDEARATAVYEDASDRGQRVVSALRNAGGTLVFGSDTPSSPTMTNPPGYNGFLELRAWADLGVPPAEILEAATLNAARAFGLEPDAGTIEAGKLANLLVLDGDPLTTVEAFDQIHVVIVRGTAVPRDQLAAE